MGLPRLPTLDITDSTPAGAKTKVLGGAARLTEDHGKPKAR
jgi:hypothetical protein